MLKRHTQLALSDATAGMTLSDAILDTQGHILLPEGTILTESMLASLRRHQIDTIAVAGAPFSQAEEDAQRDLQIARVEWLFRQSGRDPSGAASAEPPGATALLHQYVLNFRAGQTP